MRLFWDHEIYPRSWVVRQHGQPSSVPFCQIMGSLAGIGSSGAGPSGAGGLVRSPGRICAGSGGYFPKPKYMWLWPDFVCDFRLVELGLGLLEFGDVYYSGAPQGCISNSRLAAGPADFQPRQLASSVSLTLAIVQTPYCLV